MFESDYIRFKNLLGDIDQSVLANTLRPIIPQLARDMYRSEKEPTEDCLNKFFRDVHDTTGEKIENSDFGTPYENLIKNWKGPSRKLLLATYYHLHTEPELKPVAERVDKAVLKMPFEEFTGHPVPGGYSPPHRPSSLGAEDSRLLREIREHQLAELEGIKTETLMVIINEYGPLPQSRSSAALTEYVLERVREWRSFRHQLESLSRTAELEISLRNEVSDAVDRGHFSEADAILSKVIEVRIARLQREAENVIELLVLRGETARLARQYELAASCLNSAADLIRPSDAARALFYEHGAANDLYREAIISNSIALTDVATKYARIIDKSLDDADLPDSSRYGPLMSYCSIMGTLAEAGHDRPEIRKARRLCEETLARYLDYPDPVVPAVIQGIYAHLIGNVSRRPFSHEDFRKAQLLLEASLEILTPQNCEWWWHSCKMKYALNLMDQGQLIPSVELLEKSISVFLELIQDEQLSTDPDNTGRCLHNIGQCYTDMSKYTNNLNHAIDAIKYFRAALENRGKERTPLLFARTRAGMGECYNVLDKRYGRFEFAPSAVIAFWDASSIWNAQRQIVDWRRDNQRLLQSLCRCFQLENDDDKANAILSSILIQSERLMTQWIFGPRDLNNTPKDLIKQTWLLRHSRNPLDSARRILKKQKRYLN